MPDADFHRRLEDDLEAVLARLPPEWTATERNEVQRMIAVGEYGVALETLAGIAVEDGKPLPLELLGQVGDLAKRMGLSDSEVVRKLHEYLRVGA